MNRRQRSEDKVYQVDKKVLTFNNRRLGNIELNLRKLTALITTYRLEVITLQCD